MKNLYLSMALYVLTIIFIVYNLWIISILSGLATIYFAYKVIKEIGY
jgi:hypothetical protein